MRRLARDPEALIPLKPATYQILLALSEPEAMHGYAIMQAVAAMSDGRETILPGTLYAALARMVEDRLVEESASSEADASGGPPRRYYKRTTFGRAVARAESERLRALLDVAVGQKIIPGTRK
jgi:DNA-binding PadR family transcriptional regulator